MALGHIQPSLQKLTMNIIDIPYTPAKVRIIVATWQLIGQVAVYSYQEGE